MANELQATPPPACQRCGSPLTAEYHFCPNCAQEWRAPAQSLGPAPEPVFDADTRIRRRSGEVYVVFTQYLFALLAALILIFLFGLRNSAGRGFPVYEYLILNEILAGLVTVWVVYRYRYIIRPFFNLAGLMTPTFLLGLLLLPVMIECEWIYNEILGSLLMGLKPLLAAGADTVRTQSIEHVVPTVLLMCLLPAITEEIACRAFMFTSLQKSLSVMGAAFWSSVLFATLHCSLFEFPMWVVFGLYLCWVTYRTKSVIPAIIIHCLYNYFMIFLLPAHHTVR